MTQRPIHTLIYRVVALTLAGLMLVTLVNVSYGLRLKKSAATMREVSLASVRALHLIANQLHEQSGFVTTAPGIAEIAVIKKNQEKFTQQATELDKNLATLAKLADDSELAGLVKLFKERGPARLAAANKVFTLAVGFQQAEAAEACQNSFAPVDSELNAALVKTTSHALDLVDNKPPKSFNWSPPAPPLALPWALPSRCWPSCFPSGRCSAAFWLRCGVWRKP